MQQQSQQLQEQPPLQEERSSGNLRTQQDGGPWTEMDHLDSPEHRLLKILPSYVSHLKPDLAAAVTQELLSDADATVSDIDSLPVRVSSTILRKVLAPHALAQAERHSWALTEAGRPHSYSMQRTQRSSAPVLGQQSASHSGAAPAAPPRAYSLPVHRAPVGPSMLGPQYMRVTQPMQLSPTGMHPLGMSQHGPYMMPMQQQQQSQGFTSQGSSSTMLYASPQGPAYAPQYNGSMVAVQQQQRLLREALTLRTSQDGGPSSEPYSGPLHNLQYAGSSQQHHQQHQAGFEGGPGMRVASEGGMWPITTAGSSPSPSSSPWQLSSNQSTPRTMQAYLQMGASDASLDRSATMGMLQPAPPQPQMSQMQPQMPQMQQQLPNRSFPPFQLQVHVPDPAAATPQAAAGGSMMSQFTLDVQQQHAQAMTSTDPTVFAYQQAPLSSHRAPLSAGSGSAVSPNPSTTGSHENEPERLSALDRPGIGRYNSDILAASGVMHTRSPLSVFEARHSLASNEQASSTSERPSTAYTDRQSTLASTDRSTTALTERQSNLTDRSSQPLTDRSSAPAERVSWGDNVSTSSSISSTIHGSATSLPLYRRKDQPAGDANKSVPTQQKSAATWDAISPALHRDVQLLQAQTHVSSYSQPPRSPKAEPLVQPGSSAGTMTTSVLGSPSTDINLSGHSSALSKLGKGLASDCGTEEADLSSVHLTSMPSSTLSYAGTPRGLRPRNSKSFDLGEASSSKQGEQSSTVTISGTSGTSTSTVVTTSSLIDKGIQVGGPHDDTGAEVQNEPALGSHGWSSAVHIFSSTGIGTLEEEGTQEDDEDSNPEEDVGKEVLLLLRRFYPQLAPALHQVLTASTVVSDQELLRVAAASRASQPRVLEQVSTQALQTLMDERAQLQTRVRELESQLASLPSSIPRAPGSPSASSSGQRYPYLQVRTQLSHSSGRSSTWQQAKREALAAAASVGSAGIGGADRSDVAGLSPHSSLQSAGPSIAGTQSMALTDRASTGSASVPLNLLLNSRLDISGSGVDTSRASDAGTEVTFARSLPGSSANSSANSRRQAATSASGGAAHSSSSEEAHGGNHMFSPRPSLGSSSASHGSRVQEGSAGSGGRPSNAGSNGPRGSSSSGSAQHSGTHLASIVDVVVPEEGSLACTATAEDPEALGSPSASGPSGTASSISFRPGTTASMQGTPPVTWASLLSRSGTGVDRPAPDSPAGPPSGVLPTSGATASVGTVTVASWDNGSRQGPAGPEASDQEGVSSSSSADAAQTGTVKGCWPSGCRIL